jgi:hypothetical protein
VRVDASDPTWSVGLPHAPHPWGPTVSILGERRDRESADLARRGYRLVGIGPARAGADRTADLLVPEALRDEAPQWWRPVLLLAQRVFDLRMGPVVWALEEVLRVHLEVLAED